MNADKRNKGKMHLLLTGGGTGGHLYPALAVADEISRFIPVKIGYAGTAKGIEAEIVPEKGYDFFKVWISGLRRKIFFGNLLVPVKIIISLFQAFVIIIKFKPEIIFGTGGYVSWPVLLAGIILRKKIIIQEQNQYPGLVTKLTASFAVSVHLSYKDSVHFFKKKSNLQISGNPTRRNLKFEDKIESYKYFKLEEDKKTLFVFGGSQGSLIINKSILANFSLILENNKVQILWAAGNKWYKEIEQKIKHIENIRVFRYINEMRFAYAVSDLVICRSGATTVAEISRLGLAAIFIPLSTSAGNHQMMNAKVLFEANAAELVEEKDIDNKLVEKINYLLKDNMKRKEIGQNAAAFGMPDASRKIAEDIIQHSRFKADCL